VKKKTLNCYYFLRINILKLYSIPNIIISEQEDKVGGFLACTEETRNAYNIFTEIPKLKSMFMIYQHIPTSVSCFTPHHTKTYPGITYAATFTKILS